MKKQLTFAEEVQKILKMFEGRNDITSTQTKKEMLADVRKRQEAAKANMGMPDTNQAFLGALFGALGGAGGAAAAAGATGAAAPALTAAGRPIATSVIDPGLKAAGITSPSLSPTPLAKTPDSVSVPGAKGGGPSMPSVASGLNSALDVYNAFDSAKKSNFYQQETGATRGNAAAAKKAGTMKGVTEGINAVSSFAKGDFVGGITGIGKGIAGIIGGNNESNAINRGNHVNTQKQSVDIKNAAGNKALEQPEVLPTNEKIIPNMNNQMWSAYGGMTNKYKYGGATNQAGLGEKFSKAKDWLFKKPEGSDTTRAGDALRGIGQYAGPISELFNPVERGETERGSRYIGKVNLGRFDEKTAQNELDNYNVFEGVKESSGGNLGTLLQGNLAGHLNKDIASSNLAVKGQALNLGQEEKETRMNEARTAANLQLDLDYQNRKDADEGAYQTAKDDRRRAIFESIGAISREEQDKKTVARMFDGYEWDGTYVRDEEGKIVTGEDGKPMTETELSSKQSKKNKSNSKPSHPLASKFEKETGTKIKTLKDVDAFTKWLEKQPDEIYGKKEAKK
jgi:hypothetical protein